MMHFPHISMGAKHPKFNISAKQDLPLHDSRIGAFEPLLFNVIIHGFLLY